MKGATFLDDLRCERFTFQSTLPMKGATLVARIHVLAISKFQSTLPMKGATFRASRSSLISVSHEFQSTLPMKGATHRWRRCTIGERVSIHAPNEGSDPQGDARLSQMAGFNPRSQ